MGWAFSSTENLYGSLFYKTIGRIVRIEDTPIETIEDHVFQGINHTLQELHIVNSSMKLFPALALKVRRFFVTVYVQRTT